MFASGVYPTGSLMLKVMLNSIYNRELFFDSRMIPKEYPVVVSRWEGVKREVYASCIYADGAEKYCNHRFWHDRWSRSEMVGCLSQSSRAVRISATKTDQF